MVKKYIKERCYYAVVSKQIICHIEKTRTQFCHIEKNCMTWLQLVSSDKKNNQQYGKEVYKGVWTAVTVK